MASNEDEDSPFSEDRPGNSGPKPLLSHEPLQQESSSETSNKPFGPLLSKEPAKPKPLPVSIAEDAALPLESREPVEDEYHGFVDVDPNAGFSDPSRSESPVFGRSVPVDMAASNVEPVAEVKRKPPRPIPRIESIEARMDVQDQLYLMTKHELLTTKNQLKELEEVQQTKFAEIDEFKTVVSEKSTDLENQLMVLTTKLDKHLDVADKREKERVNLVAENDQLKELVDAVIAQAEKERSELPEVDLGQKIAELKEKLSQLERETVRFRKKSESLEEERAVQDVKLREKDVKMREKDVKLREQEQLLQNQQRILRKFENRNVELEETNKRLQKGNSYIKETHFQVHARRSNSRSSNLISSASEASATPPSGDLNITLICFSCSSEYLPSTNGPKDCQFHPLPVMHYREWRLWPVGEGVRHVDMKKLYWACCDKLSYGRPEGCCFGRHHQQWEMDITMKTVLLSKENLDWFQ